MIWSTHLRCAAVALFATAVSYAVSAWAAMRSESPAHPGTGGLSPRAAVALGRAEDGLQRWEYLNEANSPGLSTPGRYVSRC